jgi:hypothetical protein
MATMVSGDMSEIVGEGFGTTETVNVCELEVPPPGVGFNTVTGLVAAVATSASRIVAVHWVLLAHVVVRGVPFQRTTVTPSTNPVPFTVSVKPPLPAAAVVGVMFESAGAGFNAEMNATVTGLLRPTVL